MLFWKITVLALFRKKMIKLCENIIGTQRQKNCYRQVYTLKK